MNVYFRLIKPKYLLDDTYRVQVYSIPGESITIPGLDTIYPTKVRAYNKAMRLIDRAGYNPIQIVLVDSYSNVKEENIG